MFKNRFARVARAAVIACALGGAVLAAGCGKQPPAFTNLDITGNTQFASDFSLPDTSGKIRTMADYKGKVVVLFFGYTHCPDVCPTTLFDMSQLMKVLGPDADRANALFITVDPERDTQQVMKDYLSNFDPHLRGLTGDRAAIDAAIKAYRVYAKKVPLEKGDYTMDHTAVVYLMDKNGHFVAPFDVSRTPAAEAADLRRYL
jgi:protein SCO1